MMLEAASFVAASLLHSGKLVTGYEHLQFSAADGVIAVVLIVGLMLSSVHWAWTRWVGRAAQVSPF